MDDNIAQPSFIPAPHNQQENEPESFEDEEDNVPDWTKLKMFSSSSSKPSLPKRGDKEFEPAQGGPSNLQLHTLNRARDAMFSALHAEREISNKSISYAIWYPELLRAAAIQIRGVLFNGIGHSVPRPTMLSAGAKLRKRTELLPEEALYLIERGSLFCWKHSQGADGGDTQETEQEKADSDALEEHRMRGIPMTVQQAYAEMIGKDGLTLEKYQVYAYLKRLGFNVLRTYPPNEHYPAAQSSVTHPDPPASRRFYSTFKTFFVNLWRRLFRRMNWWKPFRMGLLFGSARNYSSLFKALRFIPAGHKIILHQSSQTATTSPYKLFYNIYKPITPFRKTAPPAPDFSLVVVDARTTPLPTLHELTDLWSELPETGVPPPRQKHHAKTAKSSASQPQPPVAPKATAPPTFSSRFSLSHLISLFVPGTKPPQSSPLTATRPPHPFAVLKNGKKTVVVGVVDSGTVSFYRFSSGAFEEMPLS